MEWIKKIICKIKGHNWNKYSMVSSYGKLVCKRCGHEEERPVR